MRGAMTARDEQRASLVAAKRVVVKIGSRALVEGRRFKALADQIAALRARGHTVVLVSSGAIALGCERLGLAGRPRALPQLQAAAAVGQSRLMQAYEEACAPHGMAAAQVLLTHDGITDRKRYLNARAAIDALCEQGALPIINENDTVSTEEIEFGDNDQLAAMVASLVGADLLVLLTDVEGLLDGARRRVSVVEDVEAAEKLVWDEESTVSLGGMRSKVGAAKRALARGLPVVIAPAADPEALPRILRGDDVGTLFLPAGAALASRKHWIGYALKVRGAIVVDEGAARALTEGKRSLLPAGVRDVRGEFRAGDAVAIEAPGGRAFARGLARYDAREVRALAGVRSDEIGDRIGRYEGDEIVHRDDLVVLGESAP
jgi:glutamate 5-kinase